MRLMLPHYQLSTTMCPKCVVEMRSRLCGEAAVSKRGSNRAAYTQKKYLIISHSLTGTEDLFE